MKKHSTLYVILFTGMSLLGTGCKPVQMVFPVLVKGSTNTFAIEKQWWDKNVVELRVLTGKNTLEPDKKTTLPAWFGPCRDADDFSEDFPFDTVWRIQATREISAKEFKVTPGKLPNGFKKIIPAQFKQFYPIQGKEYFILLCLEPVDDSVYSIGKRWIPYPERQARYDVPLTLFVTGPYTHLGSDIEFPEKIGAFCREKIKSYAPSEADVSVGYNLTQISAPIAVTIYVYLAPQLASTLSKLDKDGTMRSIMMHREFEEILEAVKITHPKAKLISKEQTSLNQAGKARKGLKATFEYKGVFANHHQELVSRAYLFNYGNWSIKYRITCPAKGVKNATEHIDNFINQLKWKIQ